HLDGRRSIQEGAARTWGGRRLPPGGLHRVAWLYADPGSESTAIDVVSMLRSSAAELHTNRSRGSTPFVFPVAHTLTESARHNAEERLAAAWLYLRHRRGPGNKPTMEEVETLLEVGYELAELLSDSVNEADQQLLAEVFAHLDKLAERQRETG